MKPTKLSILIGTLILSQTDSVKNFSINSLFSDNNDKKLNNQQK